MAVKSENDLTKKKVKNDKMKTKYHIIIIIIFILQYPYWTLLLNII